MVNLRIAGDFLVEREHSCRVVDENQANDFFTHSSYPHSGDDSSEDVVESVAPKGFEAVL